MKVKKIVSGVLACSMFFSLFGVAYASPTVGKEQSSSVSLQESTSATVSQAPSHYISIKDPRSKKVFKNLAVMSPYITAGDDNLLHINPQARSVVDADVFSAYQLGVDRINEQINWGQIQIKNGQFISNISKKPSRQKRAFSNNYWWGTAITYTNQETRHLIYALQQTGNAWGAVAAVAVFLPGSQVRAMVAALAAFGAHTVANSLSFHNKGDGVTLNIHWRWSIYYTVNANY